MFTFSIINVAQAGVISDAPSISTVGMNVLFFLLSVVGIIAIIALVLSGILYLTVQDDKKRMQGVKRAITYSILGIILAMGGMVLIKLMGQFFAN
ncbi:MAG: hypothetical protein US70_C0006G0024 [Parcubacteria group bacterium GW2011_GWD2_38_11]|nr:MAG: hypothetical protein US70_C0006G0024 [Parcubacteria group bacterium GW2011_GWD2_38_11]